MKLFALYGNPLRKGTHTHTHLYSSALHPIVYFSSTARRLSNTILAFIFISYSQDFLSLSLYRTSGIVDFMSGAPLERKDEILACGEREQGIQTDRMEREEEKVCVRKGETSTCAFTHAA